LSRVDLLLLLSRDDHLLLLLSHDDHLLLSHDALLCHAAVADCSENVVLHTSCCCSM